MILTPKNWKSFQHYQDRRPAWIKLHRGLLDDYDFCCLPTASKALAPFLWLLASEYEDGQINASLDALAFRLRMTKGELADALAPLVERGFFDASEPLAECKQVASLEKERETEEETEKNSEAKASGAVAPPDPSLPERDFFRRGKDLLGKSSGGQLTKLLHVCGGNVSLARSKLELAATKNNAAEFVAGVIRAGPVMRGKPLTAHQQEREIGREILDDIGQFIGGGRSEANSGVLRHDPRDGPEGVRGRSGGNLIELSAVSDNSGS